MLTVKRKISFVFFLCVFLNIFSQDQVKQEKSTFNIEEEFIEDLGGEEQLTSEEKILKLKEKDHIIVQGDDELLIKSRKKQGTLIEPISEKNIEWSFYEQTQQSTDNYNQEKKLERIANIYAGYGLYNNFFIKSSINASSKNNAHAIVYQRAYQEGEGYNGIILDNSSSNFDQIISTNIFRISNFYRIFLKGSFLLKDQELQENLTFFNQDQRALFAEFANLFVFPEQKFKISGEIHNIMSEAHRVDIQEKLSEKASFTSIDIKSSWDYFFGERNSLGATGHVFYADNQLYNNKAKHYLQGTMGVWVLMPIYSAILEKDSVPWNVYLKVSFDVFISEPNKAIFTPKFDLESQLGIWLFRLSIYRKTETPNITEAYLEKKFFKPIHFDSPEDKWGTGLRNELNFHRMSRIFLEGGFYYYNVYYYPALSFDSLYQYTPQKLRLAYGHLGLEYTPFKFIQYSFELRYEYFIDLVHFRPPLSFLTEVQVNWNKFIIVTEVEIIDKRSTPNQLLSLYILLNLNISLKLTKVMEFYVTINNILNQRYLLLPLYKTSGITFVTGAKIDIY